MRHPIFQNQVTILFFKLRAEAAREFESSVASLQRQFDRSVRAMVEQSFATMMCGGCAACRLRSTANFFCATPGVS
jgi:hypothetical protein